MAGPQASAPWRDRGVDAGVPGLFRVLARGVCLSGGVDPERGAGAGRQRLRRAAGGAAVLPSATADGAFLWSDLLRGDLSAGRDSGHRDRKASAVARVAASRPGGDPDALSRGGAAAGLCRGGLPGLSLRSVRRPLPAQRFAPHVAFWWGLALARDGCGAALLSLSLPLRRVARLGLGLLVEAGHGDAQRLRAVSAL